MKRASVGATRSAASLASCALLFSISLVSAQAQVPACTRTYTIVSGDTCDTIGAETLTSTYQIMALNLPEAGPDCFALLPGHEICLGRYGSDCQTVYRSTASDTCSSIASNFGISQSLLQSNNPTLDCNIVYDGLMLCVAPGKVVPDAPQGLNSSYLGVMGKRRVSISQGKEASEGVGSIENQQRLAKPDARTHHHAHLRKNSH